MSFEFAYNDNPEDGMNDDSATLPEQWKLAPEYLYQVLPDTPVFVHRPTINKDRYSRRVGVDTIDPIYEPSEEDRLDDSYMGIVRVYSDEKLSGLEGKIDGYVVDLRYMDTLPIRALGFCVASDDMEADKAIYNDKKYKTAEALAIIIHDSLTNEIHLRTKREHRAIVERPAYDLVEYVDAVRRNRNLRVIDEESSKPEKIPEQTGSYESVESTDQ